MESFAWGPHFVTDIQKVDEQHLQLVELINGFGDHLLGGNLDPDKTEKVFIDLADYSHFHFKEEEELMANLHLDPRHTEPHVIEHQRFLEDVNGFHRDGGLSLRGGKRLHQYLVHWLAYHILGSDQNMARQIRGIEQGLSPEAAYAKGEYSATSSTEPLLAALSSLFNLVSERNRELKELNSTLENRVRERTRELLRANQQLEVIALTDALTELPNRRQARQQLHHHLEEAILEQHPLSCLMIDADGFKEVNDSWGHDAGDLVLRELARTLDHATRTDDITCRLGGDEFLVICPGTDLAGAIHLAELLRSTVAKLQIPVGKGFWLGSVSIGAGTYTPDMAGIDALLKAADQGVYLAKQDGRNCVRSVQTSTPLA